MIGLRLPDVDVWSERVTVALGQNPSPFTGPGTNTYVVGTGRRRILLDPGEGQPAYLAVLARALEAAGCEGVEAVVLTHGHPDHMGGVRSVLERYGDLPVWKLPWPEVDASYGVPLRALADGAAVRTEGATLRALHTPGHAPDHLCFVLEEERALFSGDNVLGVGTTVLPIGTGDLGDYLASLERMLAERPGRIYPAHGPCIEDGAGKIREYLAHRRAREAEILGALGPAPRSVLEIVGEVYAAYPASLHAAAAQSVTHHLRKLEREGLARREGGADALLARWRRA
jgi:glyoxylase-like metal-dependent hydrolase (beta-lactamase superfamily II)